MKAKIAKRSACDYEDSLSSQGSCSDSILTHYQISSCIISSPCKPVRGDLNTHLTPQKNNLQEKSYSLRKLFFQDEQEQDRSGQNWVYQSQDSKLRKKQSNHKQMEEDKYKKHAKILKFEETATEEADKENKSINDYNYHCSSDENQEVIFDLKALQCKGQRKVGKILYLEEKLWVIDEENSKSRPQAGS